VDVGEPFDVGNAVPSGNQQSEAGTPGGE
jgi:hypothetical protein